MYEYIKGQFIGICKDYIIVENNGIGYKIFTSGSTMAKMPKINEPALLYLQQIVREDFIGLYGFLTKEEINMFNLLLTITGVGSKAALSLLSISSVTNLKYSIISGDEAALMRAPGIGKKTAQRIILELTDKLGKIEENGTNSEFKQDEEKNNNLNEALAALMALGYTDKEAQKALNMVNKEESLENIIKSCLKVLMG